MHEVPVNRLGGLSLPRKSVVRLTDRPNMTLDVYRGRETTTQPVNPINRRRALPFYENRYYLEPNVQEISRCNTELW